MPFIDYDAQNFPVTYPNGSRTLSVSWNEILWAAVTIGRPNLYHVFAHGEASFYEALFRWSLVRMSLEEGPSGRRLRRTEAFKHMDPTEKGAVNYFLGMAICKLFSTKVLNAPWCLHLDIWRDSLGVNVLGRRSRPDMIAQSELSGEWHAFECKGRASIPGSAEKTKAKDQANRVVSVGTTHCTLHIGAITYFRSDVLRFYWRDPPPERGKPIEIPEPDDAWRLYYEPFVETYAARCRTWRRKNPWSMERE